MKPSTQLWIEMLQYEKFPEVPVKTQLVACAIPGIRTVINLAQDVLKEKGWKLLAKEDVLDNECDQPGVNCWCIKMINQQIETISEEDVIPTIYVPRVYGLEEEDTIFPDPESYRNALGNGSDWICAGDLLCQLMHIFADDKREEMSIVLKAEKLSFEDGTYMVWKSDNRPEAFFYFDQTYDGRLKELQRAQLRILDEFDRICRANEISYFLGGGTLLGAVRHQGIIPWDDDIDVMMLREDYEKFVKVIQKNIGEDFHYQSNKTDSDYHSIFDKIRLNNTVFKTQYSQQFQKMHQGIFMDIFVQDRTSDYKLGQKVHEFFTLFARSLVFHKWEDTDMHFYGKMKIFCRMMTKYKEHTSMEKLEKIQNRVVTWFRNKKTKYLYDSTGDHLRNGAYPAEWLSFGREGILGEKKYPIPAEAEKYLQYLYGDDYMKLPAPQDRKATHPIIELKL